MDFKNTRNIRIGDVLKEFGYVTDDQIGDAIAYQKSHEGVRMGSALIELGYITEHQMLEALGQRLQYRLVNVSDLTFDVTAVEMIPNTLAEKYGILAYKVEDGLLYILTNDPLNFYGIEDVRQVTGSELHIELCEKQPLDNAINYYYSEVAAKKAADKASKSSFAMEDEIEVNVEEGDDDTPIINLLNSLIVRAYNSNVSDIHVEPFEKHTAVRMRMDGVIVDFMTLQKNIHNSLIARIKILGDLDIAERRVPQDGHFKTNVEGTPVNIRVSVIPTVFGEKAVLRLLASAATIDHSSTFGMNEKNYSLVKSMLQSPNGIIYVTGPTGSGKSTTLYMILQELSQRAVNISTIEDPVEKNLAKLNQMQVNNVAGLTFEVGLRALLRQDPDIIMVGETRDTETASISVRAAITGHLVLSTLHTNDASSSVTRLLDMGIEPFMLANSLVGIIAQRLVRKVCPDCAEWGVPTEEELRIIGRPVSHVCHKVGCSKCNGTGYRGRISIHEILPIDKNVRRMIAENRTSEDIKDYGRSNLGMLTLKESALELVEQGVTTVEELTKVAYYD
ncbi:MAG: Flp pilus assembly complex ATPase component TadA [Lachnospiraceae bacterium]|nr:Flp pilus assembly complex ATPase component TadA [Lachnospiraceae bacterium]